MPNTEYNQRINRYLALLIESAVERRLCGENIDYQAVIETVRYNAALRNVIELSAKRRTAPRLIIPRS